MENKIWWGVHCCCLPKAIKLCWLTLMVNPLYPFKNQTGVIYMQNIICKYLTLIVCVWYYWYEIRMERSVCLWYVMILLVICYDIPQSYNNKIMTSTRVRLNHCLVSSNYKSNSKLKIGEHDFKNGILYFWQFFSLWCVLCTMLYIRSPKGLSIMKQKQTALNRIFLNFPFHFLWPFNASSYCNKTKRNIKQLIINILQHDNNNKYFYCYVMLTP